MKKVNRCESQGHNNKPVTWKLIGRDVLDLVYPRRCPVCGEIISHGQGYIHDNCRRFFTYTGDNVCCKCGKMLSDPSEEYCIFCRDKKSDNYVCGRALLRHDRFAGQSIYELKYCNHREYADFFGIEIAAVYGDLIKRWKIERIVPVPVHAERIRDRGYNQTLLVAEALGTSLKLPVTDCLVRTRKTVKQKDLNSHMRARNMKGAFRCRLDIRPSGRVLLIDDIFTTGSTVDNCSRALLDSGAEAVYFITISIGCEE